VAIRKQGRVYICPSIEMPVQPADGQMVNPETALFSASWQTPEQVLEDVDIVGAEAAIAWGQERADVVLIRLGHRGDTYFSAGSIHKEYLADPDEPMPIWPPSGPPPEGWFEAEAEQ
jgi:hypothetical protein